MLTTVLILLPIFALILAGFACRRRGLLGPTAATEINRFVVWLALPALLFDIMAHTPWSDIYQPDFFWTFVLASALVFLPILAWQLLRKKSLADASVSAVAASYPNTGYVGFPLLVLVFGKDSLMPTTMATVIVACIFFAVAIALIEAGLQEERDPRRIAATIAAAVLRNPLVVSPALGASCAAAGITMPDSIETLLKLLGGAASPCALVGLGAFLASQDRRDTAHSVAGPQIAGRQHGTVAILTAAKLGVQPALIWVLANSVFGLPPEQRNMAVLLAALPTGTGPFMLAEYYKRDGTLASKVILVSTILSIVTLVVALGLMDIAPQ